MVRRAFALLLVLLLCGGIFAVGAPADKADNSTPPKEDYYELYKLLVDTIDQVERNYVEEIDRRELIEAAIEGVLDKLDPYSAYINEEEISSFRTTVDSEFGGIGIQLAPDPRQLTIFSPLVGTPAYRAGLLAGDRIVEIEGQSTDGMRMEEAIRRLKGKPGTEVKMAVVHPGKREKVEVVIGREVIHIDTVLGDRRKEDDSWDFMLDPQQHLGYVRVTAFSRDTAEKELPPVLEQLRADGMRGLILDLRFNPGGLLTSAIEASDLFISEGRIVSTKGRNSPERAWDAKKEGTFEGFAMVVLVNRYSASASEIVSACLQDHKRAVIMGEQTWGKGNVQNVIELEGGKSLLKLTTASYRRPSGRNIHRIRGNNDQQQWGVSPDEGFELKLSDEEMDKLVVYRRQRDVIRPKPDKPQEKPDKAAEKPDEAQQKAGSSEAKPAEKPAAEEQEAKPEEAPRQPGGETSAEDGQAAGPEQTAAAEKPKEEDAFVDRQLQMAVDYLTKRLAQAK